VTEPSNHQQDGSQDFSVLVIDAAEDASIALLEKAVEAERTALSACKLRYTEARGDELRFKTEAADRIALADDATAARDLVAAIRGKRDEADFLEIETAARERRVEHALDRLAAARASRLHRIEGRAMILFREQTAATEAEMIRIHHRQVAILAFESWLRSIGVTIPVQSNHVFPFINESTINFFRGRLPEANPSSASLRAHRVLVKVLRTSFHDSEIASINEGETCGVARMQLPRLVANGLVEPVNPADMPPEATMTAFRRTPSGLVEWKAAPAADDRGKVVVTFSKPFTVTTTRDGGGAYGPGDRAAFSPEFAEKLVNQVKVAEFDDN
jgi:hypothetical protein